MLTQLLAYLDDIKKGKRGRLINFLIFKNKNGFFFRLAKKIYGWLINLSFRKNEAQQIDLDNVKFFSHLLKKVNDIQKNYQPIPGFLIFINATLGAGGSERQIVNTLVGLKNHFKEKLLLLCENLNHNRGFDFYWPFLKESNIDVFAIKNATNSWAKIKNEQSLGVDLRLDIKKILSFFPPQIAQEIVNLYFEFKQRKPEIIHAWQDATAIKAGVAGVLAGVPKIILSTRSIAPIHFAYYEPYMLMSYQALLNIESITLVNNSLAGALDYSKWLNILENKFQVVRNGVDFNHLKRLSEEQCKREKAKLGIPESAKVIGSIYRFYPEKNPLIWVETAIQLLQKNKEYNVLLAGDGPLKKEMQDLINKESLRDRFFFMGEQKDVSLILSLLDLFLLTSTFEGTPNVVLEAQWMGVPVVAMNAGGTAEAMLDGVTGFVSNISEANHLIDLVERILSDPVFRDRVKLEGPKFIQDHYNMERMIENTLKLYSA